MFDVGLGAIRIERRQANLARLLHHRDARGEIHVALSLLVLPGEQYLQARRVGEDLAERVQRCGGQQLRVIDDEQRPHRATIGGGIEAGGQLQQQP